MGSSKNLTFPYKDTENSSDHISPHLPSQSSRTRTADFNFSAEYPFSAEVSWVGPSNARLVTAPRGGLGW